MEISITRKIFSRAKHYLTVSGQLEAEAFACCAFEGLHLWSDVPCGKLEHFPSRQRVLDDRTGNGFLRFGRQHGRGGGDREVS